MEEGIVDVPGESCKEGQECVHTKKWTMKNISLGDSEGLRIVMKIMEFMTDLTVIIGKFKFRDIKIITKAH